MCSFINIIMEGDAKPCFDFLSTRTSTYWIVHNFLNNVLELGKSFHSCTF